MGSSLIESGGWAVRLTKIGVMLLEEGEQRLGRQNSHITQISEAERVLSCILSNPLILYVVKLRTFKPHLCHLEDLEQSLPVSVPCFPRL